MMGRWLVGVCALLLWPLAALAEDGVGSTSGTRFGQGLLWKVSVPGKPASFLFGTLHVDDERVLALPPEVEAAFDASGVFVGEVMVDDSARTRLQLNMLSVRPELPSLLGAEDWNRVDAQLSLRRVPAVLRPHFQPWAVLVLLQMPRSPRRGEVLDVVLAKRATAAGKSVSGLESPEEQLAVLSGLPLDAQVRLLREAVTVADAIEQDTAALTQHYLDRNMAAAWALHMKRLSADPAVRALQEAVTDALVHQRNRLFVERAWSHLQAGGAFIAVGALHLFSESGVPALLEARGLTVEKLY